MRRFLVGLPLCVLVALLAFSACGGRGPELAAATMTLELAYPLGGASSARMIGTPKTAPSGARVTCRLTAGGRKVGESKAASDGSFALELDPAAFPFEAMPRPPSEINASVECRAGDGPWVSPLRPPRVLIG